jgi:hypothetical protein
MYLIARWQHVPLSLEVHRDDRIEVVLGHIPDHALTQVSGDVDHDIDLAELIHALLYHQPGFEVVGDGVIVCRSFAAGFPDLCNDIIGGPFLGFFAAASHTRIIDDDVDTFGSQRFCDLAPVTTAVFPLRWMLILRC